MTNLLQPHPRTPAALHALVLGLGVSGLAMARWWVRGGGAVTVADSRATPPELARLQRELPAARFIGGAGFDAALFDAVEPGVVFMSPGLAPASVAPLLDKARACGVSVGGELSLFAEALQRLVDERNYQPTVLAVTGTNGKTTVTTLVGRLLDAAGKKTAVAGNIGPSLLDTLAARLDADELPEIWVLELSSFQLDTAGDFEPTAAALLNLTQDHLDWHGSMEAYAAAKAKVFGRQALRVLNRDDPRVFALASPAIAPVGKKPVRRAASPPSPSVCSFGSDRPSRAGDFGIDTVHGVAWLVRAVGDDTSTQRRASRAVNPVDCTLQRLMPVDALRIRGRHNALNALAALALALAGSTGAGLAAMLHGLRDYRGEPHRVESVGIIDGVEYFDDSKGTNVGATAAALHGLGAERKLVVILGGDGKGQDFSPLVQPVTRHARAVVLIGRDALLLEAQLRGTGVPLMAADSMQAAVDLAAEHSQAGDAVLLSPACASFDMYRNYQHRAEAFCAAVSERSLDLGTQLAGAT